MDHYSPVLNYRAEIILVMWSSPAELIALHRPSSESDLQPPEQEKQKDALHVRLKTKTQTDGLK